MKNRYNTLDGLRGFAAIAVMIYHYTQFSSFPLFGKAYLAVDLFFCLSGFVIAYSYQERLSNSMGVFEFIKRRLIRLYPMFLAGTILGFISLILKITFNQTNFTFHDSITAMVLNLFYLPYFSDKQITIGSSATPGVAFPLNDPSWSLCFELIANIAFALYFSKKWKLSLWGMLSVSLFGFIMWTGYNKLTGTIGAGWSSDNFFVGIPRTFYGFFMGVFLFNGSKYLKKFIPNVPIIAVLTSLIMFSMPDILNGQIEKILFLLVVIPAITLIGSESESKNKFILHANSYLGWLSYPVYCIHFPIHSLYTVFTGNAETNMYEVSICICITLILSHILGKFFDEPVRKKLSSIF